jgi:hypothetical protein
VASPRPDPVPEKAPVEGFLVAPVRDEVPEKTVVLAAPSPDEPPTEAAPTPVVAHRDVGPALPADAETALPAPTEPPPRSETRRPHGWLDWGASLGFALGVVGALLTGLALVSRNGRLF